MIINRIYETQNLLSVKLVSFLVGLRTYCIYNIIYNDWSLDMGLKGRYLN